MLIRILEDRNRRYLLSLPCAEFYRVPPETQLNQLLLQFYSKLETTVVTHKGAPLVLRDHFNRNYINCEGGISAVSVQMSLGANLVYQLQKQL